MDDNIGTTEVAINKVLYFEYLALNSEKSHAYSARPLEFPYAFCQIKTIRYPDCVVAFLECEYWTKRDDGGILSDRHYVEERFCWGKYVIDAVAVRDSIRIFDQYAARLPKPYIPDPEEQDE